MCAVAVVFGVIAICLMFVNSTNYVTIAGDSKEVAKAYTGFQTVFGYKETGLLGTAEVLKFSFLNLLSYLLVLAGTVLSLLSLLLKKKNKVFDFVAAVLFVVGGVMLFLQPVFTVAVEGYVYQGLLVTTKFELGVGAVLSAVLSIVAGCTVCTKAILKK